MNTLLQRGYRLVERGAAGLACDEDGLALGAMDLTRFRLGADGARHCEVRPLSELSKTLKTAYGPLSEEAILRVRRGLLRAAASIEAGDLGRAGIEAVQLGVPDLTPDAQEKLAKAADLEKRSMAWQTEPRIRAGRPGGGQWTTGDNGTRSSPSGPDRSARSTTSQDDIAQLPPIKCGEPIAAERATSDIGGPNGPDKSLLIPVSTAPVAVGPGALLGDIRWPASIMELGRAGLMQYLPAFLESLRARAEQDQISKVIARFGLNPTRAADVTAAKAYVWARYAVPALGADFPASGKAFDAASEAIMRFVLVNPSSFSRMNDSKVIDQFIQVIEGALSDYAVESRARPAGVDRLCRRRANRLEPPSN